MTIGKYGTAPLAITFVKDEILLHPTKKIPYGARKIMNMKISLFVAAVSGFAHLRTSPMSQGLRQWPPLGGETTLADGIVAARPPGFTRSSPKSSLSVEAALACEIKLAPKK